ncbi:MAG: hypothetical protein H6753_07125 [Candidatus Omnitrophica bacterium]|nr:hypothetical protein [Candidatus Omnitrophota bacterium]
MKKITYLLCMAIIVSGCASSQARLARLKERHENTLSLKLKCSIPEAKDIVRQAGREMELIEVPSEEKEDFMILRTNMVTAFGAGALYGGLVGSNLTGLTRMGFFFEHNIKNNVTTVTIAEEVRSTVPPSRSEMERKIKFIELRRVANRQFEKYESH